MRRKTISCNSISSIWELRHNVTSYDAWYVAIAEALKLPLATLDEPLSKSNGVTCKFLTPGF
jgi:predicted nucleic acid-binding protein